MFEAGAVINVQDNPQRQWEAVGRAAPGNLEISLITINSELKPETVAGGVDSISV